jgi:2-polyprenyl-3-methyl-5-hydroxy-6-metoxy-1,4-benzoquinol methylase
MTSPDLNSIGFLRSNPNALRYENQSIDPDDVGPKLASLVSRTGRVLDVGCGTGSVTEIIKARTATEVIGIEPDPARQAMAVARGLNVHRGLLTEEFLREHGPFETILFADVLEHLPSPGEILLIAKKGLAPGGAIVASVPNVAHFFVRMNLLFGRFEYSESGIMDATHLRWFTERNLHTFFANIGLAVTDHLYTVNTNMPEYGRRPWRWLPYKMKLIRIMVRLFPKLFGCQHVVRVKPIA